MRYHLVINGFLSEIQAQMEEMCGFAKGLPAEIEEGEALLILKTGEKYWMAYRRQRPGCFIWKHIRR